MILCCWSQDPNKRPDFTSICCSLESNQFVNNKIDEKAFTFYKNEFLDKQELEVRID